MCRASLLCSAHALQAVCAATSGLQPQMHLLSVLWLHGLPPSVCLTIHIPSFVIAVCHALGGKDAPELNGVLLNVIINGLGIAGTSWLFQRDLKARQRDRSSVEREEALARLQVHTALCAVSTTCQECQHMCSLWLRWLVNTREFQPESLMHQPSWGMREYAPKYGTTSSCGLTAAWQV